MHHETGIYAGAPHRRATGRIRRRERYVLHQIAVGRGGYESHLRSPALLATTRASGLSNTGVAAHRLGRRRVAGLPGSLANSPTPKTVRALAGRTDRRLSWLLLVVLLAGRTLPHTTRSRVLFGKRHRRY